MHGTAIIIGVLHELLEGDHRASWWFTLFMLLAFAAIIWLLVVRSLGRVQNSTVAKAQASTAKVVHRRQGMFILNRITHALILDELHYWLLFVVLLMATICSDRVINIMSIGLLLVSMELVFRSVTVDQNDLKKQGARSPE